VGISQANVGLTATFNNWYDTVYLSTDATLDGSDVSLGSYFRGGLGGNQSGVDAPGSYQFRIPENTASGQYHLIFVADIYNYQPETDESDNTFVTDITIHGADLVGAVNSVAPATGNVGGIVSVDWTVVNNGDATTTSGWYDAIYISPTPTFNSSTATYITEFFNSAMLAPGASYEYARNVTLPGGIDSGAHYIFVMADAFQYQPETNENNNVGTPGQFVDVHGPDLQATSISLVSANPALANSPVTVNYTVTNAGDRPTTTDFYDSLYISTSPVFDFHAIRISDAYFNSFSPYPLPLSGGSAYTRQFSNITIPAGVGAGARYLFVVTDAFNYQPETLENNNVSAAIPITVNGPDLDFVAGQTSVDQAAPNPPLTFTAGQSTTVHFTVRNDSASATGAAIAPSWLDRVYLSYSPNFISFAQFLGSSTHDNSAQLAPGGQYTVDLPIAIASNAPTGQMYLVFITDDSNDQGETNENNNLFSIPVTINAPNLTVAINASPSQAPTGSQVSLTWTVTNTGSVPAYGPWEDAVYLSSDQGLDFTDTYLGGLSTGDVGAGAGDLGAMPLAPGATYTVTRTFTIPANAGNGPRYLLVKTDGGSYYYHPGVQIETNENDNIAAAAIAVGAPDLIVSTASGSAATANAGDAMTVSWTVTNQDSLISTATSWNDRVYLSNDATLDASDALLLTQFHDGSTPLGPGRTYSISNASINIPSSASLGSRFLIIRADADSSQSETDETNNTFVIPLTVTGPDLSVSGFSGPTFAVVGQQIAVTWTVNNAGAFAAAGPWYDAIYLSADGALDEASDSYLGSFYTGNLAAGEGSVPGA
jgi:subtilase family serine protease